MPSFNNTLPFPPGKAQWRHSRSSSETNCSHTIVLKPIQVCSRCCLLSLNGMCIEPCIILNHVLAWWNSSTFSAQSVWDEDVGVPPMTLHCMPFISVFFSSCMSQHHTLYNCHFCMYNSDCLLPAMEMDLNQSFVVFHLLCSWDYDINEWIGRSSFSFATHGERERASQWFQTEMAQSSHKM